VDAGDPNAESKATVVREVLDKLGAADIPELLVLNKIDLLPERTEATILCSRLGTELMTSAVTGEGVEDLLAAVRERVTGSFRVVDLAIPAGDGRLLALLSRVGRVISRDYDGELCRVTASVPANALGELGPYLA